MALNLNHTRLPKSCTAGRKGAKENKRVVYNGFLCPFAPFVVKKNITRPYERLLPWLRHNQIAFE